MTVTILTGASSGLGQSFLEALGQDKKYRTDEVWLIARRRERLEELAERSAIPCRVIPLDLTDPASFTELERLLNEQKPEVRLLINNAGCGKVGKVEELPFEQQTQMVDLNVRALTAITAITLPFMTAGSGIINVCSIASFVPNTRMTVYSSTKAYVSSFSAGLREEVKGRGIRVLSVCPGPMATEFLPVAGIQTGVSKTFDRLPYCNPDRVAKKSLQKALAGRGVYTPRGFYKFYRVLAKILPRGLMMKFSKV
ncbi:MAG: SDR family NAD(P)-dependent oxidoreductase [Clostridia bacterium]|nr:SDR family NAD(P)-dependent oxidoreductase [Clostridia bacterium]